MPGHMYPIIDDVAERLGVEVGGEEKIRITRISDGFPYYVHLIGEHMFWSMFDDLDEVTRACIRHFDAGLRGAVEEAIGTLKRAYNFAVQKRADDYEEVLWAVADGTLLERKSPDIYNESYVPIMRMREGKEPLPIDKFYQRMNALKRESHGRILTANQQGWYRFTETVMRGYVRLMAEKNGISLGIDHHHAPKPPHRAARLLGSAGG